MTISSTTLRKNFNGNGVTTSFTFPYRFLADADLLVYVDGVLKALTTDYTVTGAGGPSGGSVIFSSAPASGTSNVVVINSPPNTQGLDLVENDPLPAEEVEAAFDVAALRDQRLQDQIDRSFRLADTDASGASTELPSPEAGQIIGWNAGGDGLRNYSADDLGIEISYSSWRTDTFNGDGSTVAFVLASDAGVASNCDVNISGVSQAAGIDFTYVSATKTITFDIAPAVGTNNVVVRYGQSVPVGTVGAGTVGQTQMDPTYEATLLKSSNLGTAIDAAASKATPVDADELPVADSAASNGLKKLTWANLKATLKTYFDTLYAAASSGAPPVRQTILSGPVDTNGYSAFGGSTGSTTVTASGTLKATCYAGGDANYGGSITNPSWTGLSTNGTMYLFLDITSGGVVTTASSTVAQVVQPGGTPATTSGLLTVNYQEGKCYLGNGATAPQAYRVAVGEVTVAGGVVTAIVWYALLGRAYVSQATLALSTAYNFNHYLGVYPQRVTQWIECISTDNGYAVGDRLFVQSSARSGDDPTAGGTLSANKLTSNLSIGTRLGSVLAKSSPGFGVILDVTKWKFGAFVERGF